MAIHLAQGWTKGTFSCTRFEVAWRIWKWYLPIYLCDAHIASQKSQSLRFRYSTSRLLTASPVQASSLQDLRSAHFDWTETYRRQDFSDPPLAWCSRWIKPTWLTWLPWFLSTSARNSWIGSSPRIQSLQCVRALKRWTRCCHTIHSAYIIHQILSKLFAAKAYWEANVPFHVRLFVSCAHAEIKQVPSHLPTLWLNPLGYSHVPYSHVEVPPSFQTRPSFEQPPFVCPCFDLGSNHSFRPIQAMKGLIITRPGSWRKVLSHRHEFSWIEVCIWLRFQSHQQWKGRKVVPGCDRFTLLYILQLSSFSICWGVAVQIVFFQSDWIKALYE